MVWALGSGACTAVNPASSAHLLLTGPRSSASGQAAHRPVKALIFTDSDSAWGLRPLFAENKIFCSLAAWETQPGEQKLQGQQTVGHLKSW